MFSRKSQQVLKVVVLTSLVWCLLDVFILTYFSGCAETQNSFKSSHNQRFQDSVEQDEDGTPRSLLNKFIDKVPEGVN